MSIAKFGWFSILGMALCLMVSCSVRRDRERIDTAEELLYSSRDTAELVRYLRPTCQFHAIAVRGFHDLLGV